MKNKVEAERKSDRKEQLSVYVENDILMLNNVATRINTSDCVRCDVFSILVITVMFHISNNKFENFNSALPFYLGNVFTVDKLRIG